VLAALASPAAARTPRTIKLRLPPIRVGVGAVPESCVYVRVPATEPFDFHSWRIRQHLGRGLNFLHFLIYVYTGDNTAQLAQQAGKVFASRACVDQGPDDRDRRQLIVTSIGTRSNGTLPDGLVLPLVPTPDTPGGTAHAIGFLLDAEWSNLAERTLTGSGTVVLERAKRHTVRRAATPIFERTAEGPLLVPPFMLRSTEDSTTAWNTAHPGDPPRLDAWGAGIATTGGPTPAGGACAFAVTGHMHERGRFFGVDLIGPDGMTENPSNGLANPFVPGRRHFFGSPDYTDPGTSARTPFFLPAGARLHYACWDDDGTRGTVRLGCEEIASVPPGAAALAGGPAKPCTLAGADPSECPASDPPYPGRSFTGACVPANLSAGTTAEDEVCALAGFWFDAVAGAPAGAECNLSTLPVIR